MMLRCRGRGCKPLLTASHIHIGCIQSVLAHLVEMLWMGISWVHPYAGIHCSGVDNGYHDLPHQAVSIEGEGVQ